MEYQAGREEGRLMKEIQIINARDMYRAALEKLESACLLKASGKYNDSLSRSYYGAFHAITLLFMLEGQTFSRHSQLIGNFNKQFIATDIFPKELGKALGTLYDERQGADYDFFQHSEKHEAQEGIEKAELIVSTIKHYVENKFAINLLP